VTIKRIVRRAVAITVPLPPNIRDVAQTLQAWTKGLSDTGLRVSSPILSSTLYKTEWRKLILNSLRRAIADSDRCIGPKLMMLVSDQKTEGSLSFSAASCVRNFRRWSIPVNRDRSRSPLPRVGRSGSISSARGRCSIGGSWTRCQRLS
jgi:hypothetical protein